MTKNFEYVLTVSAREDLPKNGNNGNYDIYTVYYDGKLVCEYVADCDFNSLKNKVLVVNNLTFTIENEVVFIEYKFNGDMIKERLFLN